MGMNRDHELGACAKWAKKFQGDPGAAFIAKWIRHLVLKGDEAGVALWKGVAAAYFERPPQGRGGVRAAR